MAPRLFLSVLSLVASALAAGGRSDDEPIGGYVPSKSLSLTGVVLYGLSALVLWTQFVIVRPRRPFMLTLTLGMTGTSDVPEIFPINMRSHDRRIYSPIPLRYTAFHVGQIHCLGYVHLAFGMGYIEHPSSRLLTNALQPCLFLATDYMILSRLAATFSPDVVSRCLAIRPTRVVRIFVWSDVLTFFLQSSGGGLTATKSASSAKLGTTIALIGLILQAVSFLLFTFLMLTFAFRVSKHFPHIWQAENGEPFRILSTRPVGDWRILIYVMSATCVGILTRSVFRIVEFAGGYNGYVATHESFFYLFDALPLWLAMSLYCFVWPTRFLHGRAENVALGTDLKSHGLVKV
ncbi:unnamed protein product [Mycena citricolor]|uniref:RTA1-domain-containing protein n=1 Tax=Mycena citricolor TaxID=2018698 RepID=A0AAD2GZ94_9AGAR|nr:unnamed protein product [Mycena citricolor]